MSQNPVSVPTKRLNAFLLTTDTTFVVNNILSWAGMQDGTTNLVAADFGSYGRGCFRSPDNKQIEFFTFDPATIASSAITILARGCSYAGGTTDGVATKYNWPANSTLVELGANVPALFEDYMDKTSNETVAGVKTFSSSPIVPTTPTGSTDAASKAYVDLVAGGLSITDQLLIGEIAGETITLGNHVYFKESDSKWYKTDASDVTKSVTALLKGVAENSSTNNNSLIVLLAGLEKNQSSLTPGAKYYLNESGGITSTAPTTSFDQTQTTQDATLAVGEADSTTKKRKIAQSFIPNKTLIVGVQLHKIANTGTFTGDFKVALQADSAGNPSGSDLASMNLDLAAYAALSTGLNTFTFNSPYTATVGSTYWIVVTPSTADNSNHPNLGYTTSNLYANGSLKAQNTTDSWFAVTGDLTFKESYGVAEVYVGNSRSSTILELNYTAKYLPTWQEKAALVGSDVSMPVSSANKLMTQTGFQKGSEIYVASTGSANAYKATYSPRIVALVAGLRLNFKANFANTGAATFNPDGLGDIAIKKLNGSTALGSGDIASGQAVTLMYDGTNLQMLSPVAVPVLRKTGTFTRTMSTATGDQAVTGVGFTPKILRILAGGDSATGGFTYHNRSNGVSYNAEAGYCEYMFINDAGTLGDGANVDASNIVHLTGGGVGQTAIVKTFDTDGFTLTFTLVGSPGGATSTYVYIAEA